MDTEGRRLDLSWNWILDLKCELVRTLRQEIFDSLSLAKNTQDRMVKHGNFRTQNGIPICFFCKRLGHVKKHCRRRLSIFGSRASPNNNTRQDVDENSESCVPAPEVQEQSEKTKEKVETVQKPPEVEDYPDNYFMSINRSLRKLREISTNLLEKLQERRRCPTERESDMELENSLFRGTLLNAVKQIGVANKLLDSPSVVEEENKFENRSTRNYRTSYSMPSTSQDSQAFTDGVKITSPETWIT